MRDTMPGVRSSVLFRSLPFSSVLFRSLPFSSCCVRHPGVGMRMVWGGEASADRLLEARSAEVSAARAMRAFAPSHRKV
jgi:hypothetical protein